MKKTMVLILITMLLSVTGCLQYAIAKEVEPETTIDVITEAVVEEIKPETTAAFQKTNNTSGGNPLAGTYVGYEPIQCVYIQITIPEEGKLHYMTINDSTGEVVSCDVDYGYDDTCLEFAQPMWYFPFFSARN